MLRDFWPPSAGAVTGDCLSVGRAHWGPTEHTVLSRAQALPAGDTEQQHEGPESDDRRGSRWRQDCIRARAMESDKRSGEARG